MNTSSALYPALLAAVALVASGQAIAADKPEKCYGVVKTAKNDCQTASSACAGHSTTDGQADAWVYLPKGVCEKLVAGKLAP
jgi:uncharacterized membrane protein